MALMFACVCTLYAESNTQPKAVKGVLDLRNWNFDRDGPVDLSGEYAFYWDQLLDSEDLADVSSDQLSGYIAVPGFFHDFKSEETRVAKEGYGTYRLEILLPSSKEERKLAIKYSDMGTAFKLKVNGSTIISVGSVGTTADTSQPQYHPGVAEFETNETRLDLIMQVSNFHHRRGGAWENITLGNARDVREIRNKRLNYDIFLFGSIFIMAIYHFGLFLLRREAKSPLFFCFFCLLVALRLLTTGERYIMELLPAITWQMQVKLEYLSFYLSVPAFTQFNYHLFPNRFSKHICSFISIAGLVFSAAVILFPVRIFSHSLPAYQLFTLAIFIYALYVLIAASLNRETEAVIFLSGFLLIFLTALNDILQNENIIQTGDLLPLGFFLFIFSQAFLLSLRFSKAFSVVEQQRRKMHEINVELQQEVADRKDAEMELTKSQERFLHVLDSISADVYVADMQTHEILFMNQNMVNAFKDNFTGQVCWKAFRKDTAPCDHCTNDKLVDEHGKPTGVEIWECQNPITGRWYINYDRAIKWDRGRVVRLQVATDVTDRKLAEETLKKAKEDLEKRVDERTAEIQAANEKLTLEIEERIRAEERAERAKINAEKANTAKSAFLANMSHELRTPLNHIIGFTQLVLSQKFGELNSDQQEYLTDVHQSSNHLLSLINDLLDISKVEAGKVELNPTEVNLNRILENSLIMIKEKAMRHSIDLKLATQGIPDVIRADERKLKQIMYNLLSNAVKFTPDGGHLSVSAAPCDQNGSSNGSDQSVDARWLKISVKDSGIGLKQEDIDHIFKPFEQVENSTSRRFQGTGLGLSLTKNLVELHGGEIWAESNGHGQGSTFCFMIPLDTDAEKRMHQASLRRVTRADIRNVDDETVSFFKPQLH